MADKLINDRDKLFAEKIKEKRLELGYSLRTAANKIGISQVVLYNYEILSSTKYSISLIEKISEVYETTPEYLCGWENKKNQNKIKKQVNLIEKSIQTIKDILLGIIMTWTGLTTAFVLLIFNAPYSVIGLTSIGVTTLVAFLSLDDNEKNKKSHRKKFNKKSLLISLNEIFKENSNYFDFKKRCCFILLLPEKAINWQHKIFDLFLKTSYIIAIMIKKDKIDKFIILNKKSPLYEEVIKDIENFEENKKLSIEK